MVKMNNSLVKAKKYLEKTKEALINEKKFLILEGKELKYMKQLAKRKNIKALRKKESRAARYEKTPPKFESRTVKDLNYLGKLIPEYKEKIQDLIKKLSIYNNELISQISRPIFFGAGSIYKLINKGAPNWNKIEKVLDDTYKKDLTRLMATLNEAYEVLKIIKFKIETPVKEKNKQELFRKELLGTLLACLEGTKGKFSPQYRFGGNIVGAALMTNPPETFLNEEAVLVPPDPNRRVHAEVLTHISSNIKNKILCISDQPCFQEEHIEIEEDKSGLLKGKCVRTNYNFGKYKSPFKFEIETTGNSRRVLSKKWDTGKPDALKEYTIIYREKKINSEITVIEELYRNKWIPVEEIIRKPGTNKMIRRWGCAVTLAYVKPKEIVYALKEEPKYYNGSQKYLKSRGLFNEELDNEGLNNLARDIKLLQSDDKKLRIQDQLYSLLFKIGEISEEEYASRMAKRFKEETGDKFARLPQFARTSQFRGWLTNLKIRTGTTEEGEEILVKPRKYDLSQVNEKIAEKVLREIFD
jgi:hypothetical protein